MLITGPFSISSTPLTLASPYTGTPAEVAVQIQNASGYQLTVASAGQIWSVPALEAVTVPVAQGMAPVVTPVQATATVEANAITAVWLRQGESPAAPDGPLSTTTPVATSAATFVQSAANQWNAASHVAVVLAATPKAGDVLLLTVGGDIGATVSSVTQTGVTWSRAGAGIQNSSFAEVWVGVIGAGASATTTVNFSGSVVQGQAAVVELSGLTGTIVTTGTQTGSSTAPGTAQIGAVATVYVAACGANNSGGTLAVTTAGWTQLGATTGGSGQGAYIAPTTPAAQAANFALGISTSWCTLIAAVD